MQALTISELEELSGVPRSTVYYYVREGLLPVAQKAAASRAIYSDAHVGLLQLIARLKKEGLPLHSIRERLASELASAGATEVDLVAEQAEQVRKSIVVAAARLFARKGYKRTRIVDIIQEAGVTPPVFYSHFPSKQDLFVESFGVFVEWMHGFLESQLLDEPDPAARDLSRVHGYFGVLALSPDLMSLVRSEAMHDGAGMRGVVEKSYKDMTQATLEDLVRLREQGDTSLPAMDELVAFGLLGAVENIVMRASWDARFSTENVLWTTLCIFLGVQGLYTGRLDVSKELVRYAGTIERLASESPPIPPDALS